VNYGLPGPQTVLQGAKEGIIGVVNEIVSTAHSTVHETMLLLSFLNAMQCSSLFAI
jgi:hypothetical protein